MKVSKYIIKKATYKDAEELAPIMRDLDREEVWASSASSPLQALKGGIDRSLESFTCLHDNIPVGIFGVYSYTALGGVGIPWLLTSKDIPLHSKQLIRYSAPVLNYWNKHMFPYLTNMMDARHKPGLAWAKHIGFTIKPSIPFGPFDMLFHQIELRRV